MRIVRAAFVLVVFTLVGSSCTIDQPTGGTAQSATAQAPAASPTRLSVPPAAPSSAPLSPPVGFDIAVLRSSFDTLEATLAGVVGVGFAPVGGSDVTLFGKWTDGVAWSTIKVPLAISAIRQAGSAANAYTTPAITQSDNPAAEQLWSLLGDPAAAAHAVQAVLREAGDTTTQVQSQRVRPGYTAFGQTQWSMQQQTLFTARLPCLPAAAAVVALMGTLASDQQWGLARIEGAATKAGWGPDTAGAYLVRQLGVLATSRGQTAITLAAKPNDGTFAGGISILDQLTTWIRGILPQLPSARCPQ